MSVPTLKSHKKQQTMKTHLENMQNRNATRLYGNCTETQRDTKRFGFSLLFRDGRT